MQAYQGKAIPFDQLIKGENIDSLVDIQDIAHSLANIVRYNGHCHGRYTVARHSVLMSQIPDFLLRDATVPLCPVTTMTLLKDERFKHILEIHLLLHDAHEAYFSDITRPMKTYLREYHRGVHSILRAMEIRMASSVMSKWPNVARAIARSHTQGIVDNFDIRICHDEAKYQMAKPEKDWRLPGPPLNLPAEWFTQAGSDLDSAIDTQMFLDRFYELEVDHV
jgi:hypothetical protein